MNRKFTSIRAKFLKVYLVLMLVVLVLISSLVMNFVNSYFMTQQMKELSQTKEIIAAVMTESDFRSSSADSTLNTAANTMGITVWICSEPKNGRVSVYCYGVDAKEQEQLFRTAMTEHSYQVLQNIVNGEEIVAGRNVFPEMFRKSTLTIGYQQSYKEVVNVYGLELESVKNGAVILNLSLADVQTPSHVIIVVIVIVMLIVSVIATIIILILSNSIIHPVHEMRDAARLIANGDFTKELTVYTNDEIGELAESINTMTKELKELENMRSSFIANISHDFRSPLTSIKGFLEAMLDGTIPPELHEKYMHVVLDETNRLTKMTNNILDLTKMENGQDELTMTQFDLNEMLVKLAIGFERRIEDKKIHMDFQFAQEKLYVNADMDRIQRVLYNLIDNALKFTNDEDSITIITGIVGKKAMVSIADTGMGIDEKSLPHVFERFNKGDASRGNDKKGNGLGLAIVKQILLNHGEDIKVSSKKNEGTTFTFTLPLAYRINLVEKK